MNDALTIAATGLQAQQLQVDTIAGNLANLSTPAYKRARVAFEAMLGAQGLPGDDARTTGRATLSQAVRHGQPGNSAQPLALGAGSTGVQVRGIDRLMDSGDLRKSDAPMDLAIRGDGFLEVSLPDGSVAYSRGGTLRIGRDGQITTADGMPLKPGLQVPSAAQGIAIDSRGTVSATYGDGRATEEIGRLELVRFANPGALTPLGDNLWQAGEAAGEPSAGPAGEDGRGELAQGWLEGSNVRLADEMVALLLAQRGYELSAKVLQAADELMAMSNNLRR